MVVFPDGCVVVFGCSISTVSRVSLLIVGAVTEVTTGDVFVVVVSSVIVVSDTETFKVELSVILLLVLISGATV